MAYLTRTFRRDSRKDADISASRLQVGLEDAERAIQRASLMGGRSRSGLNPSGSNDHPTSPGKRRGSTLAAVQGTFGEVDPEIEELRLKGRFQTRFGPTDREHRTEPKVSDSLPDISQPRSSSKLRVVAAQLAILLSLCTLLVPLLMFKFSDWSDDPDRSHKAASPSVSLDPEVPARADLVSADVPRLIGSGAEARHGTKANPAEVSPPVSISPAEFGGASAAQGNDLGQRTPPDREPPRGPERRAWTDVTDTSTVAATTAKPGADQQGRHDVGSARASPSGDGNRRFASLGAESTGQEPAHGAGSPAFQSVLDFLGSMLLASPGNKATEAAAQPIPPAAGPEPMKPANTPPKPGSYADLGPAAAAKPPPVERPQEAQAAPVESPDGIVEQRLLFRGKALMKAGDISGARLMFEKAIQHGSTQGFVLLAQTYDPAVLSELHVLGIFQDPARAQELYAAARARAKHLSEVAGRSTP